MAAGTTPELARRHALVALVVLLIAQGIGAALFIWDSRSPHFEWYPVGPLVSAVTHWVSPFIVVSFVERRDWRSLGLEIPRGKLAVYCLYAFAGLVVPGIVTGPDRELLTGFVEQVVYIGVPEELFFRGYVTSRLLDWLGRRKALALSALIFGLAHVLSRVSQRGFRYPLHLVEVFVDTALAGLLFGFIYLRAKSIVPGSILHTSINLYMPRVIDLLSP
jgi:membrane protease YdiL (CAAX protease family)